MTVMSRDQKWVLGRLVEFAGGSLVLQDALAELHRESGTPTLSELLDRILKLRQERGLGVPELPELDVTSAE